MSVARLANRLGIEERFGDATGVIHETTLETKRALLQPMGGSAADDAEAARALEELLTGPRLGDLAQLFRAQGRSVS
jgi:hypothetical protein